MARSESNLIIENCTNFDRILINQISSYVNFNVEIHYSFFFLYHRFSSLLDIDLLDQGRKGKKHIRNGERVCTESIEDRLTSINTSFIIDYECFRSLGSRDNDCNYKAAVISVD